MAVNGKQIRLGIVGFGYWGPQLYRNFMKVPAFNVAAICDASPERLKAISALRPRVHAYPDYRRMFAEAQLNAVVVSSNVATHAAIGRAALQRGLHLFMEKPMAASVSQAQDLLALSRRRRRTLMVDHTYLYTPAIQYIKSFLDRGDIGDILSYDSTRINLGLFQRDTNVIWDLAPHDFSIMRYLLPYQPRKVSAYGAKVVSYGTRRESFESVAYVNVGFREPLIAHYHMSWLAPVKTRKLVITGSKAMVTYDQMDAESPVKVYDRGVTPRSTEKRNQVLFEYRIGDIHIPRIVGGEDLETAARDFARAIVDRVQPQSNGEVGLAVVQLLEASQRSLAAGGRFVTL